MVECPIGETPHVSGSTTQPSSLMNPETAMPRRIVLVDFYWTRDKDPRVPLGHASILTSLREQDGLDVRSVVMPVNSTGVTPGQVAAEIMRHAGGADPLEVDVAIGAYVWGEELLQGVLRQLRESGFAGRVVLGGPQISYAGPGLERIYPDADIFIRGYGEQALARLATREDAESIPGVHVAGTNDRQTQAAVDLNALPSPWLSGTIPIVEQSFIRWETQRGCPFRCAFCQHREPGARLERRALNLPRIEAEIDLFCASGVRDIAVLDPIFNMAPHAVPVLQRFALRGYTGRLSLQCRAEAVDDDFLEAAAALDVCLEFGLQTVIEEEGRVIQRRNQIARVDTALAGVRSRGIRHEVSLIFGLPLQTVSSFESSVTWCLERDVPVIKAFPLLLLRGTALERDREKWSLGDSGGAMPMVVRSSSFSLDDWRTMARISEALRLTEGHHPKTMNELRALAADLEPDLLRWVPANAQEAA
jgi:radical SAM superfamily enzyme YgiQ (UPF0313 family)